MDYVIGLGEDERQRFIKTVTELGKSFALCATEPKAQELNDEIAFFKAVKSGLVKLLQPSKKEKHIRHLLKLKQRLINLCHNLL